MVTPAEVAQTTWELWGYGDSIPTVSGDPMLDAYDPCPKGRNKCLFIHLSAGILRAPSAEHLQPHPAPELSHIQKLSRDLRYRQYMQVLECLPTLGAQTDCESLAMAELRAHARDPISPNHGRDRRPIICFPPEEMYRLNLAIIRAMPSGRYTVRHIESRMQPSRRAYHLYYRGHMRLAVPMSDRDSELVRSTPNSVPRPVGCSHLPQLGSSEVSINSKLLLKCPNSNQPATRLPPGAEGNIVGKSLLMNDVAIRPFQAKHHWNLQTATDYGPLARESSEQEQDSPDLDVAPVLRNDSEGSISAVTALIPAEDAEFNYDTWEQVARATGGLLCATKGLARGRAPTPAGGGWKGTQRR